ncbi:MAG TPA: methylmalonyl-CoA mutase family protein [Gemmatimonadota bacterium]|nr:methylmalonyl-CoA mutase family protein [Gemmatimonadota bacterium]
MTRKLDERERKAARRGDGTGREVREIQTREERLAAREAAWRDRWQASPLRDIDFTTTSSMEVKPLYTPLDLSRDEFLDDIGFPGEYPYTRGVYDSMYRTRLWTMRQFAGFATAAETNARYQFLLDHGQTGLSVAFDLPTLMGYDSDHPMSEGEVGVCGVAIDSLADMETLFEGIPLDQVSTSMTINGPALIFLALYVAVGEKQGVGPEELRGTIQTDPLKEYIAQKEWLFPPAPHLKIVVDMMAWCTEKAPLYHPISISGYHIREAGSTAVQELAFTLADGFTYVEAGMEAGLDVDSFAPRLSFFWNSHNDFFEEVAKYRAARRIWARHMKERYGAKNPRSLLMRFHTQTAGCSLTEQQPENNIVRTAIQALAGVMGGTQSLHTNSMDETYALPTEKAVKIALRTQQIIAYESGVPNVIDPLGGSYFVEALTDRMEAEAEEYFRQIEDLGGVVAGIEQGFFQREIAEAASRYQEEIDAKRRIIVGVNEFVEEGEELEIPILRIDPRYEREQCERVRKVRGERDPARYKAAMEGLRTAIREKSNLMEPVLDAVRAYATIGEMVTLMKEEYGTWREPEIF